MALRVLAAQDVGKEGRQWLLIQCTVPVLGCHVPPVVAFKAEALRQKFFALQTLGFPHCTAAVVEEH